MAGSQVLDDHGSERVLRLLREAAPHLAQATLDPTDPIEPWYAALPGPNEGPGRSAGWVPPAPAPSERPWTPPAPDPPAAGGGRVGGRPVPGRGGAARGAPGRSGGRVAQREPGRHRPPPPRAVSLPGFLRSGVFRVRGLAILAVLGVVLVVGVVFSWRVAAASQAGVPVPITPTGGAASRAGPAPLAAGGASAFVGPTAGSAAGAASAGASGAAGGGAGVRMLVVHVVGEVARPGVVQVAAGGRVVDAVLAAGGALPGADLERINLARLLTDGEQVHVPAPGEALLPGSVGATGGGAAAGASGGAPAPALVDLNAADLTTLDGLPGVGPVLAQRILDWRTEHGRFTSVDELGEVSGIGEKLLAQLRPRVTV